MCGLESSQRGIEVMQSVVHSCLENRQIQKELRGDRKLLLNDFVWWPLDTQLLYLLWVAPNFTTSAIMIAENKASICLVEIITKSTSYPIGRRFSLELKYLYLVYGKLAIFKFRLLLYFLGISQ